MSALQIFAFGHAKVRTAGTWEAPLFCASDVCDVLELVNSRDAVNRLDPDDVELVSVGHASGSKKASFVTESGLYALIFSSRKPEAKAFKKWVTSEVLPEIRKRGYYNALEVERRKTTAQLLEACFPNAPTKAKPLFSDLISALLEMRNEERTGNPPWAPALAQLVYEWAIPVEGQQEKRRELNGARAANKPDHSMFSDELRSHVLNVARVGIALAKNSMSWIEWRARMDTAFHGAPMQLTFFNPTRLPRKPRGKK